MVGGHDGSNYVVGGRREGGGSGGEWWWWDERASRDLELSRRGACVLAPAQQTAVVGVVWRRVVWLLYYMYLGTYLGRYSAALSGTSSKEL